MLATDPPFGSGQRQPQLVVKPAPQYANNSIGADLGLVPSEHTTASNCRLGAITQTGNSHVRRLLIESAWHHGPTYGVGPTLRGPANAAAY